jgi:endonuclease III related protein
LSFYGIGNDEFCWQQQERSMAARVTEHSERGSLTAHLQALLSHYGPQNWWPAQTRFEVIIGAYLTQNTSWRNVELAMANLRRAGILNPVGIRSISPKRLQALVRPSGFFRQKARRLKIFVRFLDVNYRGSLSRMFAQPTAELRGQLLRLEGVGRETADSILLYAGGHPIFVVDAYTRRIFDADRHGVIAGARAMDYDQLRLTIESAVTRDLLPYALPEAANPRHPPSRMSRAKRSDTARLFGEIHAAIVRAGNDHCRSVPRCEGCPLQSFLPKGCRENAT